MTTAQFKEKYKSYQKEAKAIATELKPLAKRYRVLCKKAVALGYKADYDKGLYNKGPEGERWPDGWNIHILFRLSDFKEDAGFLLQDARTLLLNLADQPFYKQKRKQQNGWLGRR